MHYDNRGTADGNGGIHTSGVSERTGQKTESGDTKRSDRVAYIDIDGTLTDGKLYIDSRGEKPFKAFHSRDVRAIRELIYHGFRVVLVTADDHASGQHFANKVGAEFLVERDKSKLPPAMIVIADDAWDVSMLKQAKYAYCPLDACTAAAMIGFMVDVPGGHGVVAAVVEDLKERGII